MEQQNEIKNGSGNDFELEIMHDRIISSGRWFFWISILSVINIFFYFFKADSFFVLGLIIPFFITGFFQSLFGDSIIIGITLNILAIAYFSFMGYLSINKYKIGFIAGIIIYLIDTILLLYISQWIALIWHLVALFMIVRGAFSLLKYEKLKIEIGK